MFRSLILIALVALVGCTQSNKKLVLLSKDPSKSYASWILSLDSDIRVRDFYTIPVDSMDYYLSECAGIIMTGGEDVNPSLYGKPDYKDVCEMPDNFRDSIEKVMILYAMNQKRPILGICRGQQIINVVNGGTLIPDIPSAFPNSIINHRSKSDSAHLVTALEYSWMDFPGESRIHYVNSRHHQSIDRIAEGFKVAAKSADGIVESIEIEDPQHPFFICVQWHPESLRDSLASVLGNKFLESLN